MTLVEEETPIALEDFKNLVVYMGKVSYVMVPDQVSI